MNLAGASLDRHQYRIRRDIYREYRAAAASYIVPGTCFAQMRYGVGENLSDHLITGCGFRTNVPGTINHMMSSPLRQGVAGLQYILARRGPLATGPALAGGFIKTDPGLDAPDLQFFFSPQIVEGPALAPFNGFSIAFYPTRPESRGQIRITSRDATVAPSIRANYLTSDYDVRLTLAGLRLTRQIAAQHPLAGKIVDEVRPGKIAETDEQLLDYVRQNSYSGFHHVGTCKIGTDALAVVDSALRVHGVDRLRVIDGSVMPAVISGNTNAACYMIGEKGADMILTRG